jgi:hypothetical protein
MVLAPASEERYPLLGRRGILGQGHVARELEDSRRRLDRAVRLLVVEHVPDAGGAVLRITRPRDVHVALLTRRVGAEERDEGVGAYRLVPEQPYEVHGLGKGTGQERALVRDGGVYASYKGSHAWA